MRTHLVQTRYPDSPLVHVRMFVRPSPGIEFACKYRIQSQLFCSQAGRDEEKRARAQHGGGGRRRGGSASAVRLGKHRISARLLPTDSARCVPLSLCLVDVVPGPHSELLVVADRIYFLDATELECAPLSGHLGRNHEPCIFDSANLTTFEVLAFPNRPQRMSP